MQETVDSLKPQQKPMKAQPTDKTEAAGGYGMEQESSHSASLHQETMALTDQHWNNAYRPPVIHSRMNDEYKQMMNELKVKAGDEEKSDVELFDEQQDLNDCNEWLNMYGTYVPPVPKYLLIKDVGGRRFSGENILRRTAWLGRLLNIKDKNNLPEMRKIEIKQEDSEDKEKVIAVVTDSKEQAETLLNVKSIGPCKVRVVKDTVKNTISGVLFDQENFFKEMHTEDMTQMLAPEGVIKIYKIGGEKSRSYRVVFDKLTIPERVKLFGARTSFPIRDYIPPPLRCYKCQKYDHGKFSCRQDSYTCQRCGGQHQNKTYMNKTLVRECTEKMFCIHCKQEHEAGNIKCPIQISQVEVNQLMVRQNLSRFEAKSRVFGPSTRSDAKIVTSAIRLGEANKELEETKKQAAKDKDEITNIHNKLDSLMSQMAKNSNNEDSSSVDDKIAKAVQEATRKMKEDNDNRFEAFQKQLTEQSNLISDLTNKNKELQAEAHTLKEQLQIEKNKNLELRKKIKPEKTSEKAQEKGPEAAHKRKINTPVIKHSNSAANLIPTPKPVKVIKTSTQSNQPVKNHQSSTQPHLT